MRLIAVEHWCVALRRRAVGGMIRCQKGCHEPGAAAFGCRTAELLRVSVGRTAHRGPTPRQRCEITASHHVFTTRDSVASCDERKRLGIRPSMCRQKTNKKPPKHFCPGGFSNCFPALAIGSCSENPASARRSLPSSPTRNRPGSQSAPSALTARAVHRLGPCSSPCP